MNSTMYAILAHPSNTMISIKDHASTVLPELVAVLMNKDSSPFADVPQDTTLMNSTISVTDAHQPNTMIH